MDAIPADLKMKAFWAPSGELGWSREDAHEVIRILADSGLAILGGELWFVPDGERRWTGLIPQREGERPVVYTWATDRETGEEWPAFVGRSAADSSAAVDRMPGPDDLPKDLGGRILYNLNWVSETELTELEERRGRPADSPGQRHESGGFMRGLSHLFGKK